LNCLDIAFSVLVAFRKLGLAAGARETGTQFRRIDRPSDLAPPQNANLLADISY
jgi:hypothetical protein